jgi:hypothetical protein
VPTIMKPIDLRTGRVVHCSSSHIATAPLLGR